MNIEFNKVIPFPNKRTRRAYKKKLFSWYTTIDLLVVIIGVTLGDILRDLINKFLHF